MKFFWFLKLTIPYVFTTAQNSLKNTQGHEKGDDKGPIKK